MMLTPYQLSAKSIGITPNILPQQIAEIILVQNADEGNYTSHKNNCRAK